MGCQPAVCCREQQHGGAGLSLFQGYVKCSKCLFWLVASCPCPVCATLAQGLVQSGRIHQIHHLTYVVWELALEEWISVTPPCLWSLASSLCPLQDDVRLLVYTLAPWSYRARKPFASPRRLWVQEVMGPEIQMWSSVVAVKYQRYCHGIVPQIQK